MSGGPPCASASRCAVPASWAGAEALVQAQIDVEASSRRSFERNLPPGRAGGVYAQRTLTPLCQSTASSKSLTVGARVVYVPRSGLGGRVRIFLVRHGDADAEVPEGLGDEARALTVKARQQIGAHFASVVDRIGVGTVGLLLTSPLVRAVQTAQILSAVLKYEGPLRAH